MIIDEQPVPREQTKEWRIYQQQQNRARFYIHEIGRHNFEGAGPERVKREGDIVFCWRLRASFKIPIESILGFQESFRLNNNNNNNNGHL